MAFVKRQHRDALASAEEKEGPLAKHKRQKLERREKTEKLKQRELSSRDATDASKPAAVLEEQVAVNSGDYAVAAADHADTQVNAAQVGAVKSFEDLGIIESLCEACETLKFKHPTPIQAEAIPLALEGRDIIGLAETGSGKTAAFALPILQALMDKPQHHFALVLAPTRELAIQSAQQFSALGSVIKVQTCVVVGGQDYMAQAVALQKKPHIIVATPGRLLDFLENEKGFSLRMLKYLVIDEADRLLDMDFGPVLDKILRVLPRERKTYLFSATMSSKVESLQRASLSNPVRVSVKSAEQKSKHMTVATLLQSYIFMPHVQKDFYLVALLSGPFKGQSTIIFGRTIHDVQRLTYLLRALGLGAIPLHGQLSQNSRISALNKFKAQSRDILVATDVASRGLDIPSVGLVLNYDLPADSTTYVHRVGRTARAGKSGHAINLVSQYDVEVFQRIEKALGRKLDEYKGVLKNDAISLKDYVSEAQRSAIDKLKDEDRQKREKSKKAASMPNGKGKGKGRMSRDDQDRDEG